VLDADADVVDVVIGARAEVVAAVEEERMPDPIDGIEPRRHCGGRGSVTVVVAVWLAMIVLGNVEIVISWPMPNGSIVADVVNTAEYSCACNCTVTLAGQQAPPGPTLSVSATVYSVRRTLATAHASVRANIVLITRIVGKWTRHVVEDYGLAIRSDKYHDEWRCDHMPRNSAFQSRMSG
jgi:hypothetical protein